MTRKCKAKERKEGREKESALNKYNVKKESKEKEKKDG